ncbi:MAG: hypothetical protein LBR19_01280, partial [Bifidobacteriaceae bacterium]|nr:hypothetical protein [Bifidobacteriaceae bacterium]
MQGSPRARLAGAADGPAWAAVAAQRERWARAGRWLGLGVLGLVPLGFLGVFFAWPVVTLVTQGFVSDGAGGGGVSLDFGEFGSLLAQTRTWRLIGRTVGQAVAATALVAAVAVPLAHVLYRRSFPGRAV